jgi:hypothetical protein
MDKDKEVKCMGIVENWLLCLSCPHICTPQCIIEGKTPLQRVQEYMKKQNIDKK